MQPPTCYGMRVRTKDDALRILHAVNTNKLRMVTRRLDTNERRAIRPGYVFVWEERGPSSDQTGMGIERWTDSIQWGPSRVRDEFLYYQQRRPAVNAVDASSDDSEEVRPAPRFGPPLLKQTYSAKVLTATGIRKWHLIAYFNEETVNHLFTVDNHPHYPSLARIKVPTGVYKSARTTRRRGGARRRQREDSSLARRSLTLPSQDAFRDLRLLGQGPSRDLPRLEDLRTILTKPRHPIDQLALNSLPPF
ncbi:Gti1/Pac2 family-domain-containing protein [Crepidotus variabilis]|uniref:Gti1/Pac2 family-domain-containing protein n=1 Tax=Crepidotus variabilis TaxID=179855 RepID=A0A9P6JNF1_9AGAR|nr:Gti1/Pac2 family-domain-containing protein [Crepidotus variabilis]